METVVQDLRHAGRSLRQSPAFTVVSIATLALAIGANAAIFSLFNGVVLRPLSYHEPDRLTNVFERNPARGIPSAGVAAEVYLAWRERQRSFTALAAVVPQNGEINGVGEPLEVAVGVASPELFSILAQTPLRGRLFTPEEHTQNGPPAVLISRGFWLRQLGGDESVLSRTLTLNGTARPIVGVMPDHGEWMRAIEVWTALPMDALAKLPAGNHILTVVGRLRPGATVDASRAELAAISEDVMNRRPDTARGWTAGAEPLARSVIGSTSRAVIVVLFGAVGCILLIACANLGNLMLVRAHRRRREMAMRAALGAGRWRLIQGLAAESALVALSGAGLGVLVGLWLVDAIRAVATESLPRLEAARLDLPVLAFTVAITAGATMLFGLLPAIRGSRIELQIDLRDAGRIAGRGFARDALAVVEIALAMVLTACAALLLQSLSQLYQQPLGYEAVRLLALDLDLPARRFPTAESRMRLVDAVERRIRALPGVVAVGSTRALPLESGGPDTEFEVEGRARNAPHAQGWAFYTPVSSGYLETMGATLLAGRHLTEGDNRPGAAHVAIVNETLAGKYWPDGDAVGQRLVMGPRRIEVVGVVRDLRQRFLRDVVQPQIFLPFVVDPTLQVSMTIRASGDPLGLVPSLRGAVWAVDPNLPVEEWTMETLMHQATAQSRFATWLIGAFAGLAMLLALIGVYGVVSYGVSQRRRELGIRMALGAPRSRVLALVLGRGAVLGAAGIAFGMAGAFAAARGFQSLLFGVSPNDPATLAGAGLALGLATLAASLIPARRAARVDPMIALRAE